MRVARTRVNGHTVPIASLDEKTWYDLSPLITDVTPMSLSTALHLTDSAVSQGLLTSIAPTEFAPPMAGIGKIVCVGLNYADHARETGMPEPTEPILFMKAPDTISGPNDDVPIPRGSTKTDWEVELGVVIGRECAYLDSVEQASMFIAGYVMSNDVSEREHQLERGGQWDKGKNGDRFNPLGPWIRSASDVPDVQGLEMRLSVNGVDRQVSNTSNMIFGVQHLVWYISQFMRLYAGDIINTGTPHGVAMGLPGTPYLRPGDVVELSIESLGTQRQRFV